LNACAMARRSEAELLGQLRTLLRSGSVTIAIDAIHLDKLDSPVAVQAESTRWLYALLGGVGAAAWWQGMAGLAGGTAIAVAIWIGWVRRDVGRRIRNRVETQALHDATLWRKLWRHGGVRLVPRDGGPCVAPRDNWMQFVRDRVPAAES
jgi:hypothetical protein